MVGKLEGITPFTPWLYIRLLNYFFKSFAIFNTKKLADSHAKNASNIIVGHNKIQLSQREETKKKYSYRENTPLST